MEFSPRKWLKSIDEKIRSIEGAGVDGAVSPDTHRLTDISYEGSVSKWTNYLHGWQLRYLVLRDGTLYYYKSESDTGFGSRGSVRVAKTRIEVSY